MPDRLHLSRKRGYRLPPGAVSVARPTVWGNPFKVGEAVSRDSPLWPYLAQQVPGEGEGLESVTPLLRETVVAAHGWWFIQQPHLMLTVAAQLGGRDLACWCLLPAPGEEDVCHAAFLLAIANDAEIPVA